MRNGIGTRKKSSLLLTCVRQRMIFGVENQIDTKVTPFESSSKIDLTVVLLELCEARKKLEKIKEKENFRFSLVGHGCTGFGSHEESEFK